ncbi:MAG: heavy-metal-associated domain-containing protein [Actinomycetaceae bacterium]|nr:heavy-metal-associated domain-containing protein [Actinomycetaceae bacterium]
MTTVNLYVKGLTCGHCVASVTEELGEIKGVARVNVDLNAGEDKISKAEVSLSDPVDDDAFRDAIAEAGYDLVSIKR